MVGSGGECAEKQLSEDRFRCVVHFVYLIDLTAEIALSSASFDRMADLFYI